MLIVLGGCSDNEKTYNGEHNPYDECITDEECLARDGTPTQIPFLIPSNVRCLPRDDTGTNHCNECLTDADCAGNVTCKHSSYCSTGTPCDEPADCGTRGEFHQGCYARACGYCERSSDCMQAEICYPLVTLQGERNMCITESNVDPACLDGTCPQDCQAGTATDGSDDDRIECAVGSD